MELDGGWQEALDNPLVDQDGKVDKAGWLFNDKGMKRRATDAREVLRQDAVVDGCQGIHTRKAESKYAEVPL